MFLSKDKSKKINVDNLFDEYATILSRGGPAGKKGDKTVRKKEIIYGICEDCGSYFYMSYGVFLKRSLCICSKCVIKKTKLENHGDANFNNRKKAFETNMETYQTIGTPRKGINKGISKSVETRNKISQKAKERFKNKVNHPMYGKKHTEESKKKNKHSNLEYLKEEKFNIRNKIRDILKDIRQVNQEVSFFHLIKEENNQLEIVVSLLALLELMKRKRIKVVQENNFSDIRISMER